MSSHYCFGKCNMFISSNGISCFTSVLSNSLIILFVIHRANNIHWKQCSSPENLCDSVKTHKNVLMVSLMFELGWFYSPVCFLCVVWFVLWPQICLTSPQDCWLHFSFLLEAAWVWIFEKCKHIKPVVTCITIKVGILCACMSQTESKI